MKNSRITNKERNLLKGAIRRVFSRSELRLSVIKAALINHIDTSRPRVKAWGLCKECQKPTPKSYLQVDHIQPVIGLNETLEDLSWDTLIDRIWCRITNLNALCEECHIIKSKKENKLRREHKRGKSSKKSALPRRNS